MPGVIFCLQSKFLQEASWAQAEACGQLPGPGPRVLLSPSQESQPQASGSERESGTLGLGALSSRTDSTFNWLGTWASHLTSSGFLLPHLPNGSCDSRFNYLPAQTEEESSIPYLAETLHGIMVQSPGFEVGWIWVKSQLCSLVMSPGKFLTLLKLWFYKMEMLRVSSLWWWYQEENEKMHRSP